MEIRARYLTIGLFTLGVIAAGFMFVYWLYNSGGLGARDRYSVQFKGSVAGLFVGSPVTFNGLRVGEVSTLRISPVDPSQMDVVLSVEAGTPVRSDTKAGMEFQGLTGAAAVALTGGSPGAAPAPANRPGDLPMLMADANASQSMTQSARTVMQRLDTVLTDNAEPLKATIGNLNTFTGALARNSDRVDGIISGIERMTGATAKKTAALVVDLTPPQKFSRAAALPKVQIALPEPTAIGTLDTEKLVLDPTAAADTPVGAQWADALPKLLQARFVQSFENAGLVGSVIRGGDAAASDYQLQTDVHAFRVTGAVPALSAEFELAVKVLNAKGRIVAGRVIKKSAPISASDPKAAAAGLDEVFGKAAEELVLWTAETVAALPPPKADDGAPMPLPQ